MQSKILLVDDREDSLFSMETILEPDGYTFVKAASGRQALKILLTEFDFALILMDVKMPTLNGFETAALIYEREKLRHIPIIFITANNYGEEHVFKGYKTGAVDYIFKPVNPELLRTKVAVFIELHRKNHQLMVQEQKLIAINKSLETEINERKVSEEKVNELNRQLLNNIALLEGANRELDSFAFMASHDLQEPLRKIRTFGDLLAVKYRAALNDEANGYIRRIQSAAERMQTLIKDILAFSRVSSEKDKFERTDINNVVRDALMDLDDLILEKKAKVELMSLPPLEVNPGLIRPLFFNLVGNALKYSKKDVPPVVHIRFEMVSHPPATLGTRTVSGQPVTASQPVSLLGSDSGLPDKPEDLPYCQILIQDNGIGFDQQFAAQIFEMFRRLHVSHEFEGTGIGLALCKKIVEKHNGFIDVESELDKGSVFKVTLPVRQQALV
ncbi:MAG: response regulator [Candidatus Pseudobacter hemicellulosilyticus]|uniref:histidine kinase n=1 Tax=Candidatus Pseudobacter hemicellulosilyticus TaxID=3121375 RepID=A0AAJ5WPU4_9BACT|nr:MAG: response regulator [Pseudobacter sp.]